MHLLAWVLSVQRGPWASYPLQWVSHVQHGNNNHAPTGGDCGGDENKLQLDGAMCVSHLAHNNFQTLAIITLTFLSLV